MRGDSMARQWRLLRTIATSSGGISVGDLARQENLELRTVYRDLEVLQEAGFPLFSERQGRSHRWHMLDNTKNRTMPTPYGKGELVALWMAKELLQGLHNNPLYPALDSLFHKLSASLNPGAREQVESVQSAAQVESLRQENMQAGQQIAETISKAIKQGKRIQVVYRETITSPQTVHLLDPYRIWRMAGFWYLLAHCPRRQKVLLWSLARMQILNTTDEPLQPLPNFDLGGLLRQATYLVHDDFYSVRLKLDSSWQSWAASVTSGKTAPSNVRQLPDGTVELDLQLSYLPRERLVSPPAAKAAKNQEPPKEDNS